MKTQRKILSLILAATLMMSAVPTTAFAENEGAQDSGVTIGASGLCEHHTGHTADCGYTEGTPETACAHEHTAECYPETDSVSGNEATPTEAAEPTNCTHTEHTGDCGYAPAVEGTPCVFECAECAAAQNGNEPPAEQTDPIAAVQALIDALPGADEITADNAEEVAAQLTAIDEARAALTDEEQAQAETQLDYSRYMAAAEALSALAGEPDASTPELAAEETGGFTVTGGTLNTDYTYADSVLTVKTATNLTIKNTDPDTATTDRIVVELTDSSATADITLAGVNIAENNQNDHLVTIRSSASIALSDTNTLTGNGSATSYGIYIHSSAQDIAVSIGGDGTLASSGSWTSIENNGETLTITSSTITAAGDYRGIDSSGVLKISGGNVDASGNYGIYNDGGTIGISGGNVDASGNYGIYNDGGTIGISGGTVAAPGTTYAIYNAGEGWAFNLTNNATLAITGGYLYVSQGGTFTIGNGSKLTIEKGARLIVAGSTGNINAGLLTNEGTVNCAGAIALAAGTSIDGSFDPIGAQVNTLKNNRYPYTGGQIWNKGALNIQSGGVLNINQGAITTFTNGLNNQGCLGGRLYSTGTVTVAGTAIVGGTADEAGARTAQGSITLEGESLTVADGGVLTVNGEVGSYRAGTKATSLNNSGAVTVDGTLQMVDAGDTVTNTGTITVEKNGNLNFTHPGTANTDPNVFTNSGKISIRSGGKLNISGDNATLNNGDKLVIDAGGTITNGGSISNGTDSKNPDATMELNGTLTNSKQFTIQNISGLTGSGKITASYSGATFVCNEPAVVVPENLTYTGEAHTIELSDEVEFGGTTFTVPDENKATNWTAAYTLGGNGVSEVKDAGSYTATFTHSTHDDETVSTAFTVAPKTVIPTIELTIPDGGYTYDGTAKTPAVTVKDGDVVLTKDTDYAVTFSNNTNAGTATVTITDVDGGNYIMTEDRATFEIAKASAAAPAAPTNSAATENSITLNTIAANSDGATVQYSKDGLTWQDSPEFTGLTAATPYTFYARYAESKNYLTSAAGSSTTIYTAAAHPVVTIDYGNETLSTDSTMEYSTDGGGTWTDCTATMTAAAFGWDGTAEKTVLFRVKATSDVPESTVREVTIPARPAAPSLTIDDAKESVTVPVGYCHNTSNAYGGTAGSGSAISVSPGTSIYIYQSAGADAFKSLIQTLTAPARLSTPTVKIDYADEALSTDNTMQYKVGSGEWTNCTADITLESVGWMGTELTVSFRAAATGGKYASEAQSLTIPARPVAPTGISGVNEQWKDEGGGQITGVNADMEYRLSSASGWTTCSGTTIDDLAAGSYEVRLRATSGAFAGEAADVTIASGAERTYTLNVTAPAFDPITYGDAQPGEKAITISSSGNSDSTITGVALSGEGASSFTLNKTDGTTVTAGSTDSTTYTVKPTDSLDAGTYTATITVTYNGGATATATVAFTVNYMAQDAPAAPEMESKSTSSITLKALADGDSGAAAEYRVNGGAWQTSPVFGGLSSNTSYTFEARYAATGNYEASPAGPAASFTTDRSSSSGDSSGGDDSGDSGYTPPDTGADIPQTGDNSHTGLWIGLLLLSAAGLAGVAVFSRRRRSTR